MSRTLGIDTFIRANQSGWETASDGETWSNPNSLTLSISGNKGIATGQFGNESFCQLGANIGTDMESLVRIIETQVSNEFAGSTLRYTDTNNFYLAYFNGFHLWLYRKAGPGTGQDLAQTTMTQTSGQAYWLRFNVTGSTLSAKLWQDGSGEPTSWTLTATDSNLTSGGFGLYNSASGSGDQAAFDQLSCTGLSSTPLTHQGNGRFLRIG